MVSVLRSSTDDSAPILQSHTKGSLTNLLKTVLCTGYGSQPSLGWTVEYEDVGTAELVIRGGSGTRFFVKIDDNQSALSYRYSRVMAFESMADIDTGYLQCPSITYTDYIYIAKSLHSTTSGIVPWKIIGDDKGFWILTRYGYPAYASTTGYYYLYEPHYIGDYTPFDITNKWNFITILHHSNGGGYFYPGTSLPTSLMRNPLTKEPGTIPFYPSTYFGASGLFGVNSNYPPISPINGKYLYNPVLIFVNNISPVGIIPGYLNMLWRPNSWSLNTVNYYMSIAEAEEFFEEKNDRKIFIFPHRYVTQDIITSGNYSQRGSIIVGEGFRDAY